MVHGRTRFLGIPLFDGPGAVWLFFVISGFLITTALSEKYSDAGGLRHFYWNRAIRLFPSYWTWLIVIIGLQSLALPHFDAPMPIMPLESTVDFWRQNSATSAPSTLLIVALSNITGLFSDSIIRTVIDPASGGLAPHLQPTTHPLWGYRFIFVGQLWSIGVEIAFYLIAPIVVRRIWLVVLMFALSASGYATILWRTALQSIDAPAFLTYIQLPIWLWMFMIGAILAHGYRMHKTGNHRGAILTGGLFVVMIAYVASRGIETFPMQAFPWWLFALVSAAVPFLFHYTASNRIDNWLGDLSYPIYVNHFIVITLLRYLGGELYGIEIAMVSMLLAWFTVKLVEKNAGRLKWKSKRLPVSSSSRFVAESSGMIAGEESRVVQLMK
jgi:peptidoglycan/LPS O-acetylase OafA/YrhL